MSLDIGGTSADVALIFDGTPAIRRRRADRRLPDLHSVRVRQLDRPGRRLDRLGRPARRPQGRPRKRRLATRARPATAAAARAPTVTDGFVAAACIGHSRPGLQRRHGRSAAGRARPSSRLPHELGVTVERTAEAISEIAVSGMYAAVSGLVSRFGIDPREFSLIAFGGAGPMLACFLARELEHARGARAADARRAQRARRPCRRSEERLHPHRLPRSQRRTLARPRETFAGLRASALPGCARSRASTAKPHSPSRPTCATAASPTRSRPPLDPCG